MNNSYELSSICSSYGTKNSLISEQLQQFLLILNNCLWGCRSKTRSTLSSKQDDNANNKYLDIYWAVWIVV